MVNKHVSTAILSMLFTAPVPFPCFWSL